MDKKEAAQKTIQSICDNPPVWSEYDADYDGYIAALEHSLGELITAINILRVEYEVKA